jgi:SNF2 family DNA or RNA helicase
MKLSFKPFESFIKNYTTQNSRNNYDDSTISQIDVSTNQISAKVKGTKLYSVQINFNTNKVINASCSCLYDKGGYCKHIIHTLVSADKTVTQQYRIEEQSEKQLTSPIKLKKTKSGFTLENKHISTITEEDLKKISDNSSVLYSWNSRLDLREASIKENLFEGKIYQGHSDDWTVKINQEKENILLSCSCYNPEKKICSHLQHTISEILKEPLFQLSFNEVERHLFLQENATKMGLFSIENPDELFEINFSYGRVKVNSKYSLLTMTNSEKQELKKQLVPEFEFPKFQQNETKEFIVVHESNYNKELVFSLMKASLTKTGELKSPIEKVAIQEKMRQTVQQDELLFYAALLQQGEYTSNASLHSDIVKNPVNFSFYYYESNWDTKKITPKNIEEVFIQFANPYASIYVKQSGDFYVLTCEVSIDNKLFQSKNIQLTGSFFISGKQIYFIDNERVKQVLLFFKNKNHEIFIHTSQFSSFKEEFLDKLEQSVTISYSFVKKAPAKIIKEKSLNKITDYLIYLSESDDYILITPVICYGEIEVSVLSKRTVYTENPDGTIYSIERNESEERRFLRAIQTQHPSFDEFPSTEFYYLHKQEFLEEGWFIDVFEEWRKNGFSILGFNQLKNNRYNPHKMKVQTQVISGIDWFDIKAKISFGKQEVGLKEIQKSIINKTRFVQLDDGTQGVMPQEWLEKFGYYFRSGEIKGDAIRTHKSNFQLIDDLFEKEVLSTEIQLEIEQYRKKLAEFQSVKDVNVPKKLNATLRDYQKEGLNWLNFLDEFGFGGCLADDMGLGKTIQIIAYFLSQHEKGNTITNLVIVPTSLLFNWQREIDKFAPHLKYTALYGINRETHKLDFNQFDVIFTTYGTLLSDVEQLKQYTFNCIVLDESQAIKNPESKRYKAVRLLQSRQKLVVTGTPVENNTFDLFSQLSFAVPGLFGSAKRFATDYSTPIDKFQDTARAKELQKKVYPFILRRTKKQVAKELPEKTEMVVYCEMDTEQQRVYDTYKIEFQKYLSGLSEDELHSSSLHILQGLTKLRQICNSPALLSDDEFYGNQSAKMEELIAQINNLKGEHKILVFSQFVGMLDLIKRQLDNNKIRYAYLTGQTKKREEQVELFQNDDSVRVFLISLKAGGTGLNLTKAEYVFLIDPWWNPAVENQAIDRAHRIGQENKVVAVRLITPNTIEEKIMELQQRKRQLVEDLIHTDNNIIKQLTKEDLIDLV